MSTGPPEFPHGVASVGAPGRGFDRGLHDCLAAIGGLGTRGTTQPPWLRFAEGDAPGSTERRQHCSSTFVSGSGSSTDHLRGGCRTLDWTLLALSWTSLRLSDAAYGSARPSPPWLTAAEGGNFHPSQYLATLGQATPPQSTSTTTRYQHAFGNSRKRCVLLRRDDEERT